MSVFDEAAEKAIKRAFARPDVQTAMQDMTELIIPYISVVISAALEEKQNEEIAKRSEMNGE